MTSRFKFITKYVRGVFRTVSLVVLASVLSISLLGLGIFYRLTTTLPDVGKLKFFQHSQATEVYSDEGKKIGEFTTERRYPVSFEAIPKHVINAFLAAEDAKFYEHKGIDYNGILRAVFSNLTRGRYAQGGSTITQQVARALLLETKKKEITRKVREMVLAWRMERQLSKREILNLYLKEIYLGHGSFGIGAAARNYFNKKVEDLTLGEATILAGLPQRPNEWNPIRNPHLAKKRQAYVLKRMVDEGFVKSEAAKAAYEEPLHLHNLEDLNNSAAPYFTEYVRHYLMTKYGSEQILSQGYKVYTTVRYDFQKAAERSVDKGLREVDKRLGWRGPFGHMEDPTNQETFLRNTHLEVVEALNPPRILYPEAAQGTRGLEYDLEPYSKKDSAYFGATPVKEGESYKALVFDVENEKAQATARIGKTQVLIPFATMAWVKIEGQSPKRISEVLKPGDTVVTRIEKIDRRGNTVTASLDQEPEIQGALLSYETENGFVRAMVGGNDFKKSKFNCALQAKRQVGSTFKPLMYAAAFDKGFSPASMVTDAPIVFKTEGKAEAQTMGPTEEEWKPHNYGNKFEGDIPLRTALVRSMNVPTVKLLNEIGVDYGIQYARTLGITSALPRDLTIGLGSWSSSLEEMMRAYAIFPRLGKPVVLRYIKRVEDSEGKIIEEYSPTASASTAPVETPAVKVPSNTVANTATNSASGSASELAGTTPPKLPPGHVISPQTAYVMTDMLKAVIRDPFGTAHGASSVKGNVAGKTGTTNDHRDAWFIGYSPALMAGVWIGYLKEKALDPGETGGKAAAPIWADYMKYAADSYTGADFPIPDDIVFAYMDRNTGKLAGPGSTNRVRVAFKAGTVPNQMGDNIPRVGEPGVRGTGSTGTTQPETGGGPSEAAPRPNDDQETSDFIRQEYQ